ncbi:hypothetical protein ACFL1X_12955 [Candidatus Hydrogenedentota bacterium]
MKSRLLVTFMAAGLALMFLNSAEAIRGSYGKKTPSAVILGLDKSMQEENIAGQKMGALPPITPEEYITRAYMQIGPQPELTINLQRIVAQESDIGGIFPRYAYMAIPENFLEWQRTNARKPDVEKWENYVKEHRDELSPLVFYRSSRNGRQLSRVLWQEYLKILQADLLSRSQRDGDFGLVREAKRISGHYSLFMVDNYYKKAIKWLETELAGEKTKYDADKTEERAAVVKEMSEEILLYRDQANHFKELGEFYLRQVDYITLIEQYPGYEPREVLEAASKSSDSELKELAEWAMAQLGLVAWKPGADAVQLAKADPPLKPGLQAGYYSGFTFSKKVMSKVDGNINQWWDGPFNRKPKELSYSSNASTVWQGKLIAPSDGDYQFYTNACLKLGRPFKGRRGNFSYDPTALGQQTSGARLFIDGVKVLDTWVCRGTRYWSGRIALDKGAHDFKFEFHSRQLSNFDSGPRLYWSCADEFLQEIIPSTAFYHDPKAAVEFSSDAKKAVKYPSRGGRGGR